jgi:hypothetical protein
MRRPEQTGTLPSLHDETFFLQHPFLQSDLTKRYTRELLDKVNSPTPHAFDQQDGDDEGGDDGVS